MKGGTEQDDEEFEMLLGEIPSATSVAPHPEEVQRPDELPNGQGISPQGDAQRPPNSEAYGDFYQGYCGVTDVSISTGANIVSLSPSSSSSFPPFYGSMPFDGSGCGNSKLQREQRSQLQATLHLETNMEQEEQQSSIPIHQNAVALSTQQIFTDDKSLTTAFSNLSFKEGLVLNQALQASGQYCDGGFGSQVLVDGQDPRYAARAYSAFDVVSVPAPGHFNGVASLNLMNSPSHASSSLKMYGPEYPSQHRNANGEFQPPMDESSPASIKKLLKVNAFGVNTYGNNLGFPFDNFRVDSLEPQPQFPIYSAAVPPVHGMQGIQVLPSASISGAEVLSPISGLQQLYFLDSQTGTYLHPQQCSSPIPALQQQINRTHLTWQHIEQERCRRMQQQYILLQQVQTQALAGLPDQVAAGIMCDSLNRSPRQQGVQSSMTIPPQIEQSLYKYQQQGVPTTDGDWSTHIAPGIAGAMPVTFAEFPVQSGNMCRYYAQGFCGRGESCPFSHSKTRAIANSRIQPSVSVLGKDLPTGTNFDGEGKTVYPEKILTRNRSRGGNSVRILNPTSAGGRKDSLSNGNGSGRTLFNGHHSSALHAGSFQLDSQGHSRGVAADNGELELIPRTLTSSQQQPKYTSLEEVEGRIYFIARDQHGCRFLQRKFDEGSPEDVQKIFLEIIDHIIELMTDPFGNYLVQKLLEVCNEDQRMQIIHAITGKQGELVNISLNMHGTRAVQKLIETLKTPQQVSMVISSLKPGVVTLIKDLNGNHVVQRCLQCLVNEDSQFLFDAAAVHCVEIATHRHGCCVLQRCVDFSSGAQRQRLVAEISANALVLSQDPFGNYVVQYILDLGIPWATADVMDQLEGSYAYLSMQKFSSNVVEKCLKLSGEERRARIIRELINNSRLGQLLQDPYANYVVQSALAASKGALHAAFVEAIRPHLPALRSSPFGKRILSRTNLKK